MHDTVSVRVADLLLDPLNARFSEEVGSQPEAFRALARLNPKHVVTLAEDIVENGMDPLTLPGVVATGDRRKRYTVLEGNRRVLALKALDTPSIIASELTSQQQKRLAELSARFLADPIDTIDCVLFEDEAEARHWIFLRHTGLNDGAGVLGWDPDNQDAFKARHGGQRSMAGQVVDFLQRAGSTLSTTGVSTTIERLVSTPTVRAVIGLRRSKGQLLSDYPADETLRGLEYIVAELSSGRLRVGDVYEADARRDFAGTIPSSARPRKAKKLSAPVALHDLPVTPTAKRPVGPTKPTPRATPKKPAEQTSVVPRSCQLSPGNPRLSELFDELARLPVSEYPNAVSVLLRVFIELSVDHYIERENLTPDETKRRNAKLGAKLKQVAEELHKRGDITRALRTAICNVADGNGRLMPSVQSMHQYVHNFHAYPKASELQATWNEMQPFLEKIHA